MPHPACRAGGAVDLAAAPILLSIGYFHAGGIVAGMGTAPAGLLSICVMYSIPAEAIHQVSPAVRRMRRVKEHLPAEE
jgi:hypothetical protein